MREIPKPKADTFTVKDSYSFAELLTIMAYLRGPEGCPWDRAQDHHSLRSNLLEEAYEVIDTIDREDYRGMTEELGDLLLQVLFHAQLAREEGHFYIDEVISGLGHKLISRHSHVFGNDQATDAESALVSWRKNKYKEKAFVRDSDVLKDVPASLPALSRSEKVQKKAAKAKFDWTDREGSAQKIEKEWGELQAALADYDRYFVHEDKENQPVSEEANDLSLAGPSDEKGLGLYRRVEEEAGDCLFALVNYLRHIKINPELALTKATEKFIARFSQMEDLVLADGKQLQELDSREMNTYYEAAKQAMAAGQQDK